MAGKSTTKYGQGPMAVRMADEDREALARMGARLGIGSTTVLRVAMRIGLETLEDALSDRKARARAVIDRLAAVAPSGEE